MRWVRVTLAVAGSVVAAATTLSCGLLFVFEVDGFGGDRNAGPQPLLLLGYVAGAVASVVATAFLWRWLVPQAWGWGMGSYLAAVVGVAVFLGLVG